MRSQRDGTKGGARRERGGGEEGRTLVAHEEHDWERGGEKKRRGGRGEGESRRRDRDRIEEEERKWTECCSERYGKGDELRDI